MSANHESRVLAVDDYEPLRQAYDSSNIRTYDKAAGPLTLLRGPEREKPTWRRAI